MDIYEFIFSPISLSITILGVILTIIGLGPNEWVNKLGAWYKFIHNNFQSFIWLGFLAILILIGFSVTEVIEKVFLIIIAIFLWLAMIVFQSKDKVHTKDKVHEVIILNDTEEILNSLILAFETFVLKSFSNKKTFDELSDIEQTKALGKICIRRVLPLELTSAVFQASQFDKLTTQYERFMEIIIPGGEANIEFWDQSIYGCTFDHQVREKTIDYIKTLYLPAPDTTHIGVDVEYNHLGFFLIGETSHGPKNANWQYALLFFSDPSMPRGTPLSGFATRDDKIIELINQWWIVLQAKCVKKGNYLQGENYRSKIPGSRKEDWKKDIDGLISLIRSC